MPYFELLWITDTNCKKALHTSKAYSWDIDPQQKTGEQVFVWDIP
jgi:hypothetical protein